MDHIILAHFFDEDDFKNYLILSNSKVTPDFFKKTLSNFLQWVSSLKDNFFFQKTVLRGEGIVLDSMEGWWVFYHTNGSKRSEGIYVDGKREGYFRFYYREGLVETEGTFNHNLENGLWFRYHPNGQKEFEGKYDMGNPDGDWVYYDNTGMIIDMEKNL